MGCNSSKAKNSINGDGSEVPSTSHLRLVLETWRYIYSHKQHAGIILIQRLICSDDSIRAVFERAFSNEEDGQAVWNIAEIQKHGIVVLDTIDVALHAIDDLDSLNAILFDLGKRHSTYGVKRNMFIKLWESLASTFKTLLRDAFTNDVQEAWYEVFKFLVVRVSRGLKPVMKNGNHTIKQ